MAPTKAVVAGARELVGFAYEFQVVKAVPRGPRDRRVDAVATECRIRWAGAEVPPR